MPQILKETANQIAVAHLKRQKSTDKIYVAEVEAQGGCFIVRGTCPIDLQGLQWAEIFEVVVDPKGKIKSTNYAQL